MDTGLRNLSVSPGFVLERVMTAVLAAREWPGNEIVVIYYYGDYRLGLGATAMICDYWEKL